MPEYSRVSITPIQEEKLKIAVENTCELCHDYYPSLFLEIHRISGHPTKEMKYDPSTRILMVCKTCHAHIHQLPVSIQKQRVSGETPIILYSSGYPENTGICA